MQSIISSRFLRVAGTAAVSLVFISSPVVALADTELLTSNPGFETGSTGWTQGDPTGITAAYSVAAGGHTGSAGNISVSAVSGGEAKWLTPFVSVTPGQVIIFSDWYKSDVLTSVFVYPSGPVAPTWIGDAGASPSTFSHFTGQTYLVPAGVTSIQFGHAISAVGTLATDDYSAMLSSAPTQFTKGMVTLTFDDGWDTFALNAQPILDAKGFKATNYVLTGLDGSNIPGGPPNGGYMTPAQILALKNAGYDVEDHTANHFDLAKDDPAASGYPAGRASMWTGEINNSIAALGSFLGTTIDSFAYPFGSYCAPTLSDCSAADVKSYVAAIPGLLGARSVDEGYNVLSTDKFALKQQHIVNASMPDGAGFSVAKVQGWIDFAVANKVWLILMFHDVRPTLADCKDRDTAAPDIDCTDTATLQGIVDYLSDATKVPAGTVMTMHQVLTTAYAPTVPTIAPHADVFVEATSTAGAVPNYTLPTVTPAGTVSCLPLPASNFAMGSTTVSCTSAGAATTTFAVGVRDTIGPVVTLNGSSTLNIFYGDTYAELGATANDAITASTSLTVVPSVTFGAVATTSVNTFELGTYLVTYSSADGAGNVGTAVRTVNVGALPAPVLSGQAANNPSQTTVSISWTTDHLSTSRVVYGTASVTDASSTAAGTPNWGYPNSTSEDTTLTTNHTIVVTGLTPGTTYFFRGVSHGSPESISAEMTRTTDGGASTGGNTGGNTSSGGGGGGGGSVSIGSLSINNGAATTSSQNVSLTISGPGIADRMWISNDITFGSGSWAPLTLTAPWTLTPGAGKKSVYIRFGLGTTLIASAQDDIALDPYANIPGGVVLGASTSCYNFAKNLSTGSKGPDVTALQTTLTAGGYYSGPITGTFGPLTSAGVKKFQSANGIDAVGSVGPKTRAALNSCGSTQTQAQTGGSVLGAQTFYFTQTLMLGSSGSEVTQLQTRLTGEGVYSGPVTGYFGTMTQAAVKAYQSAHGLPSTGVVGPLTRAVLNGQ